MLLEQQDDSQLQFPGEYGGTGKNPEGRSRTSSVDSDCSRESFLDNLPARASFSFQKQIQREAKLTAENQKFDQYRLKLKAISLFFVFLSTFIMLNACIGASSAPFYDKYTDCSKYELDPDCKELMKYSSALYGFEVVGSLVLTFHGLLGMTLLEYIKTVWLIRTLNYYTKVALVLYICDVILRSAMYFKILDLLAPVEENNHSQDFGGFLAVYVDNDVVGIIITIILMVLYGTCFLSTCYMWRISAQLQKTATEVEEEKVRTAERKARGSIVSSNSKSKTGSIVEDEEAQQEFSEFDYNGDRAKKASQVILSINDDQQQHEVNGEHFVQQEQYDGQYYEGQEETQHYSGSVSYEDDDTRGDAML